MGHVYCQICGARNDEEQELCRRCNQKLLVISGPPDLEDLYGLDDEAEEPFSLDEHLLERISILEEVVRRQALTVRRTLAMLYKLEQKILVSQTGVTTLRDLLEGKRLIGREEWGELWEARMDRHLLALEMRERFTAAKGEMAALYRGESPELLQRLLDEVETALFGHDLDHAVRGLEAAADLDPGNHEMVFFLAETLFNQGRRDDAYQRFQQVLMSKPGHFESLVLSAVLLDERGESERAAERLEQACAIEPESFLATFARGAVAAGRGQLEEAVDSLEEAVELEDVPQAHYLLGSCFYELGRLGRAIEHLEVALRLDPTARGARRLLALAYLDRGWFRKAGSALGEVARSTPLVLGYDQLGRLTGVAGPPPVEGSVAEDWHEGDEHRRRGRARQALSAYRRALSGHGEDPGLLVAYAMACLDLGRGADVPPVVDRVLHLDPGEPLALAANVTLLEALRSEGQLDEGADLGRRLLAECGTDRARTALCYEMALNLAVAEEDLDQALSLARRSLDLAPRELCHLSHAALGWVHFKRRELDQAAAHLSRSQEIESSAGTLTHLAIVLLAAGEREHARRVLHQADDLRRRGEGGGPLDDALKEGARLLQDPSIRL